MEYLSFNKYLRDTFGEKVYKISINAGFTCPNRDGTLGTRGCIFCSKGGSGDFAESAELSVTQQIEKGKRQVERKIKSGKYIAYFQAFTNTYAPVERLKEIYYEAVRHPDIAALSIATRPDCLGDDVLKLIEEINRVKPVFVELGLQTIHKKSAEYIRRGYPLEVYNEALERLNAMQIHTVTHIILGLPDESREDMLESVKYVCDRGTRGIKLQLLHILDGTDLADEYRQGKIKEMGFDEYVALIRDCVRIIPKDVVIHRLTGDGDKKTLIAPLWSADKKRVLNAINKAIKNEVE